MLTYFSVNEKVCEKVKHCFHIEPLFSDHTGKQDQRQR